ncbi:MAG: carboxypeptidase regulatory-like domain-containing protein [Bryobacteraceae bacterium]
MTAILYVLIGAQVNPASAQLSENCTVNLLNRTAQVDSNGNWSIANLPVGFGPVRARAVCVTNGTTSVGQSGLFTLIPNQSTGFDATMLLGPVTPIPDLVTVTSPNSTLASVGATTQLAVSAHYPFAVTANITAASTGTTYITSNPVIATVSTAGVVQAVSSGTVIIQAMNEGATGMTSVRVVLNSTDTDHDGIPDDIEIQNGLNPNDPTDALLDADNDGLSNLEEFRLGTNMRNADSDGDGIGDLVELRLGLNPLLFDVTTTVQGRVVDSAGAGVIGANVTVFGYFKAVTGTNGSFTLPGVPARLGDGNITGSAVVLRAGAVNSGVSNVVPAMPAALTDLGVITILVQGGIVTGVITDPSGRPVPGAQVTVIQGFLGSQAVVADPTGNYRVAGLVPGSTFSLIAFDQRTGFIGITATEVQVAITGPTTASVRIGPAGTIQGTVFQSDGVTKWWGAALSAGGQRSSTDSEGRYAFSAQPAGSQHVQVDYPHVFALKFSPPLSNGETRTVNIIHPGLGTVHVTVKDAAGNLLPNSYTKISSNTQFIDTTTAISTPRDILIVAGDFSLTATDPATGLSKSVTGTVTASGTTNIEVTLDGALPGTVHGTVTYDGSTPVPYPNVFITQTDSFGPGNHLLSSG